MSLTDSYIINGPAPLKNYGNLNIGQILYDALKLGEPTEVFLIDVSSKREITRGECCTNSIKLAKILQTLGISAGDVVAIISPNSWKFLISVLSAFYLGATVTFSNPNYLKDELHHFIDSTSPKILFLTRLVYEKIKTYIKDFRCIEMVIIFDDEDVDNGALSFDNMMKINVDIRKFKLIEEDQDKATVLILFSSGTSGLPKGVMLSQQSLKSSMGYLNEPDGIAILDGYVVLNILPFFHIFGFLLIIAAILKKTKAIIIDRFKPDYFLKAIEDYKVTCIPLVPPLLVFLAQTQLLEKYDLSSLDDILCGGAPTGIETENLICKRLNGIIPRQVYGETESCGAITCSRLKRHKPGSVGQVVQGHHVKIVDCDTKEILGPYKYGEVYVRGAGVMKGYLDNPEQTKQDIDEDHYLHTGDLGYFDEEGYLFIVDRIKEVIKYKGFQVSPTQLEKIILEHDAVRDVGVIGLPNERAGELPTAFIVKKLNASVSENDIIDFVADRLSYEKHLHGGVNFIEEIPRNGLGKILRRELKKLAIN